jgi:hypothetical protein
MKGGLHMLLALLNEKLRKKGDILFFVLVIFGLINAIAITILKVYGL